MPKTIAIIQARMGSTRLPGKVLLDLGGASVLERVVARTRRATRVDDVVIATSTLPGDDVLEADCRRRGWRCVRGDEADVLDRFYVAARAHTAELVIRITSDCPLIDPEVIDRVVDALPGHDYATNALEPRTFPRGLDVEAFPFDALERAWREDANPATREHVTPYLYKHPEIFSVVQCQAEVDASDWRWTVDTPEDLALVRAIYAELGSDDFSWRDALAVCEAHPEWRDINRHIVQKAVL